MSKDSIDESSAALREEAAASPEADKSEERGLIKESLQKQLNAKDGVNLNISSDNLAAAVDEETDITLLKNTMVIADTTKPSAIPMTEAKDALTAEREDTHKERLVDPGLIPDVVSVTEADKEAFLSAAVYDGRLKLPFSVAGGKVKGVLRNRTLQEHIVIQSYLMKLIESKLITTEEEYQHQLRSLILMSQVESINGKSYPEMQDPLDPSEGEAGWLKQYQLWLDKDNKGLGITRAIFIEVRKFEAKYWAMIQQANNENFWQTAEST